MECLIIIYCSGFLYLILLLCTLYFTLMHIILFVIHCFQLQYCVADACGQYNIDLD